ncbi:nucleotidyl transferase AbiEii/AbiGii toxin family protein [Lysinibacillus sp. UGB7]|uniref:nucleotidyl transferase AbiEii/AbiGii toxin family protein n=1 Tax=Lysinibacillus sp. UGB7 TaxID=3411039 RepID=UPI003B7EA651
MNLHKDKIAFEEFIPLAADHFGFQSFQIEKDYYVSLFLKNLIEVAPEIIFKGGTSLSKCYDVINRFSEDIDLTIYFDQEKLSRGALKANQRPLIDAIMKTVESLKFSFLNNEDEKVVSGRHFNKYKVGYERSFSSDGMHMLQHILIETMLSFRPYPCEEKFVSNYITKFLEKLERYDLIEKYELQPFNIRIQSIDRTFLDKLFAICDYHEAGDYKGKSRHLYDIHMIYQSDFLKLDILPTLVNQVIETRRDGKNTYSCQTGYKPVTILQEIIDKEVYKGDYYTNTKEFLSEFVNYEEAINSLKEIIAKGWIPNEIPEQTALVSESVK